MRYRVFGRSGLRVSEVALGAMTFGDNWGGNADRDTVFRMMDRFGEEGGNFVDTGDIYADGMSERILGEFVASDRDHWVVATKYSGESVSFIAKLGGPTSTRPVTTART